MPKTGNIAGYNRRRKKRRIVDMKNLPNGVNVAGGRGRGADGGDTGGLGDASSDTLAVEMIGGVREDVSLRGCGVDREDGEGELGVSVGVGACGDGREDRRNDAVEESERGGGAGDLRHSGGFTGGGLAVGRLDSDTEEDSALGCGVGRHDGSKPSGGVANGRLVVETVDSDTENDDGIFDCDGNGRGVEEEGKLRKDDDRGVFGFSSDSDSSCLSRNAYRGISVFSSDGDGSEMSSDNEDGGSLESSGSSTCPMENGGMEIDDCDDRGSESELSDVDELSTSVVDDVFYSDCPLVRDEDRECCYNCRRTGGGVYCEGDVEGDEVVEVNAYMVLHYTSMQFGEIPFGNKYCFIRRNDSSFEESDNVRLCWQCYNILKDSSPVKAKVQLYGWPAFIRALLDRGRRPRSGTNEGTVGLEIWTALPSNFRKWWSDYVRDLGVAYRGCTVGQPKSQLSDVTQVQYLFQEESEKLESKTLFPFFDRYLSKPQVLCPWGCSEFVNRCNVIPFEALMLHTLRLTDDRKLSAMIVVERRKFLDGVRSDFLDISHNVLHLPGWQCRPRMCFDIRKGPQILCCRFHSSSSTGRYLHLPRPVGCVLASRSDNRFAPATAKPRTVGCKRGNLCRSGRYTDSYQTTVGNGRYDGFDTLVLSDNARFDSVSIVSNIRDAISVCCRPDIAAQLDYLVEHEHLPDYVRKSVYHLIDEKLPSVVQEKLKSDRGGTYIATGDAIRMQENLNSERETHVLLENGSSQWFRPPWPALVPLVHGDNDHGACFPPLPYFGQKKGRIRDYRFAWLLLALVTSVSDVWSMVAASVEHVDCWKGWILLYAMKHCYTFVRCQASKNNLFGNCATPEGLFEKCQKFLRKMGMEMSDYGAVMINCVLNESLTDMSVVDISDFPLTDYGDHKVLVVTNSLGETGLNLPERIDGWCLQAVVCSGCSDGTLRDAVVFSRHGGTSGSKWWRRKHSFHVCGRNAIRLDVGDYRRLVSGYQKWDVVVYTRESSRSNLELRLDYMRCCGFQTRVRCHFHKLPLIVNARFNQVSRATDSGDVENGVIQHQLLFRDKCLVCDKTTIYYCCSLSSCKVKLCRKHYEKLCGDDSLSHHEKIHLMDERRVTSESDLLKDYVVEHQDGNEEGNNDETEMNVDETFDHAGNLSFVDGVVESGALESDSSSSESEKTGTESEHSNATNGDNRKYEGGRVFDVDEWLDNGQLWLEDNNVAFDADMIYEDQHDTGDTNDSTRASNETTESDGAPCIPTARSAGMYFRSSASFIGSHVMFNKHGRLLVRQKKKIRPSQSQSHWLQKIVARNNLGEEGPSDVRPTIPLLYPEATLFSNIFYKARNDGSVVGALPTALMTDNTTVKRFGMATLHDHMRTRITSTALLTSSDNTYLLFALDACLNLGTRGHDTRVQLKRGWDPDFTKGDGVRMKESNDRSDEVLYTVEQMDNRIMCDKVAYAMVRELPVYFWTFTMNATDCFGMRVLKRALDDDRVLRHIVRVQFRNRTTDIAVEHWTDLDLAVLREQLLASSAILAMRIYENFWNAFRQYLLHSSEKPLGGTVTDFVDRTELQEKGGAGNLPHHHTAVWLKEIHGNPQQREQVINNIRGCVNHIIHEEELHDIIEEGVVASSLEDVICLLDKLAKFLPHSCHIRCLRLDKGVKKGDTPVSADGNKTVDELLRQGYRCKVPNNHLLSPTPNAHVFRKIQRPHCKQAKRILQDIGLMWVERDEQTGCEMEILDDRLYAVQHIPPTTGEFGPTSPVLARLVLLLPGNQNVQLLDSVLAARYLTKYIIMLDESNRLYVQPPSSERNKNTMNVGVEDVPNTKVSSIQEEQEQKKKGNRKNYVARIVGTPEVVMLLLNFEQVFATQEFTRIVTAPLEERPGMDRQQPRQNLVRKGYLEQFPYNLHDVDVSRVVISHRVRQDWRQGRSGNRLRPFDTNALVFARDQCFSNVTIDPVTKFSLRPPELYWVRHMRIYFECFVYFSVPLDKKKRRQDQSEFDQAVELAERELDVEYDQCAWIDATFQKVKVRRAALSKLIEYTNTLNDEDFAQMQNMPNARATVTGLLKRLTSLYEKTQDPLGFRSDSQKQVWNKLRERFLCHLKRDKVPVGFYKRVPPKLGFRFLYSLLLGMGKFTTEMDITYCPTLREAFVKTGLVDSNDIMGGIRDLLRRYVLEHMPAQGGGTSRFDEDIVTAYNVLQGALIHGHAVPIGTPPVLLTRLREEQTEKVTGYIAKYEVNLVKFILTEVKRCKIESRQSFPTDEQLLAHLKMSPSTFNALWSVENVLISTEQSEESYSEQRSCLQKVQQQLHELVNLHHERHPKCMCIVGGPGCGKTTVMVVSMLHAMSMSLRCMSTALLSARALQLAGIHWHSLFCLPVEGNSTRTAGGLAERALANLHSYGQCQLALLQYLDVLFLDELGPLSNLFIASADIICRYVRKSDHYMGGLIVVSTYDIFQLPPINAVPPLLSPHMMTSFRFHELRHSVRAANDPPLRELQNLTRTLPDQWTNEKKNRFVELFTSICTFVDNFEDARIPTNAIYVFGKREPGRELRDKKLREFRVDPTILVRVAKDEERTHNGDWKNASVHVTRQLDRKTKEDRELFFVPGMVYEITGVKKDKYHNHQLCMLWDVPTRETIEDFSPVKMIVAPPGCKDYPSYDSLTSKQELFDMGWTEVPVGTARDNTYKCNGGIKGRRKQYALRLHIYYTLHAAMGCTVSAICSRVSKEKGDPYYLWEKAQVIVLLSRTRCARNMYFVGDDPVRIANDLLHVLQRETQYFRYMLNLLSVLLERDGGPTGTAVPITFEEHPFRPIDIPLPTDKTGYCYLLVSLKSPGVTYIGETDRLGPRLNQHNTGIGGAVQTKSLHLRPWGMLCYVVGFEYDKSERKSFESRWEIDRQLFPRRNNNRNPTPQDVIDLGCQLVYTYNQAHGENKLRMVLGGSIKPVETTDNDMQDSMLRDPLEFHLCVDLSSDEEDFS